RTSEQQQTLLTKCDASEGFVWQRSEAQGVTRLTKDVTETLEGWILELAPAKKASPKVELIKGRASYSRKGSNLALNLKKVDDATMEEILAFVQSKLD
ncbi:chromosome partitioning protein ParB, partial [Vibrio sp. 10N.261.45.A7]